MDNQEIQYRNRMNSINKEGIKEVEGMEKEGLIAETSIGALTIIEEHRTIENTALVDLIAVVQVQAVEVGVEVSTEEEEAEADLLIIDRKREGTVGVILKTKRVGGRIWYNLLKTQK
jgi:hypothetical protein